jgi:uncharacterized membrane protein YbhN (UPF0104 family)
MVPIVLLVYIFRLQARLFEVYIVFKNCRLQDLFIAFLLLAFTRIQVAFRLHFLSSNYFKAKISAILKDVFIANLFNTILPAGSGEIYRIKGLADDRPLLVKSTALVTLDRLYGILSILTIAFVTAPFSAEYFSRYYFSTILYIIIGLFVLFILIGIILNKVELKNRFAQDIKIFFTFMHEHPLQAIGLYVYSISIIFITVLSLFFISKSLNWDIEFFNFLKFYPWVLIVSSIPISIGGLGVREIAIIATFGSLGVSKAHCVSLGLMQYALMLAISSVGFMLFISDRNR